MRKLGLTVAVLLAGWLGLAVSAGADDSPPPPGAGEFMDVHPHDNFFLAQADDDSPRGPGRGRGWNRADWMQQRKHLEQLRMLKMLELLDLDEAQEVPFLIAFNKMRSDMEELDEKSNQIIDSLAAELRGGDVSDTRVNSLIDRNLSLQNDKHQRMMAFVKKSRDMLTAEQMGKLVIFQKRFESEILERIGRFRQGMDGRPNGPGSPGRPLDSDG